MTDAEARETARHGRLSMRAELTALLNQLERTACSVSYYIEHMDKDDDAGRP